MSPKVYRVGMLMVVVLLAVLLLVNFLTTPEETVSARPYITEVNTSLGYSFTFPSGDAGFFLDQSDEFQDSDGFRKALVLVPYVSLSDYRRPATDTAIPPVISIFIFDNIRALPLGEWLSRFNDFSRYDRALDTPTATTINDLEALRYSADGPYHANVVAVQSGNRIALLVGEYTDSNSSLYSDFWSIVAGFNLNN